MPSKVKFKSEQILEMLKLALILFAVTAITALMLSFVNELTAPRIEVGKQKAVKEAMSKVLPAESYEEMKNISELGLDKTVVSIYTAKNGSDIIGYCVKTMPRGFGGQMEIIVGVDIEDKVTQVNIVSMAETPGLGTKTRDENFLSQFTGKNGEVNVITGTEPKENEISAVTGATVSSKAVTAGVQAALNAVVSIKGAA